MRYLAGTYLQKLGKPYVRNNFHRPIMMEACELSHGVENSLDRSYPQILWVGPWYLYVLLLFIADDAPPKGREEVKKFS